MNPITKNNIEGAHVRGQCKAPGRGEARRGRTRRAGIVRLWHHRLSCATITENNPYVFRKQTYKKNKAFIKDFYYKNSLSVGWAYIHTSTLVDAITRTHHGRVEAGLSRLGSDNGQGGAGRDANETARQRFSPFCYPEHGKQLSWTSHCKNERTKYLAYQWRNTTGAWHVVDNRLINGTTAVFCLLAADQSKDFRLSCESSSCTTWREFLVRVVTCDISSQRLKK